MRRMITEKDVEKLDSIKPSEIEKLAAMQDPKTVENGYVLTANGRGQAVYKKPSVAGSRVSRNTTSIGPNNKITTDERGTYLQVQLTASHVINVFFYQPLTIKNGETTTTMNESLFKMVPYITGTGGWDYARIYFTDEAITKYSITAESQFSGVISYTYYSD